MCASVFLPSIPQIATELHTTDTIISVTVAIFVIIIGIAPVIWSPLSGFYGRKPIYLASMPLMVVASIGVAQSRTVAQLIGTRCLQGFGSSVPLVVGAGTVGDIYRCVIHLSLLDRSRNYVVRSLWGRPTERANAMGWFYSGVSAVVRLTSGLDTDLLQAMFGPALSPAIAGIFAEYTAVSLSNRS